MEHRNKNGERLHYKRLKQKSQLQKLKVHHTHAIKAKSNNLIIEPGNSIIVIIISTSQSSSSSICLPIFDSPIAFVVSAAETWEAHPERERFGQEPEGEAPISIKPSINLLFHRGARRERGRVVSWGTCSLTERAHEIYAAQPPRRGRGDCSFKYAFEQARMELPPWHATDSSTR